ncbi:MAG: putative metal-binding motif-containing protein [Planctomycetes bacterium]|nr:putative metal-binding motif-containing protein [Planctomycetota bacterium]
MNGAVHPGAQELCNGIDDDCDLQVHEGVQSTFHRDADGDGFGDPSLTTLACSAPSGFVADATDCDDANGAVHPGAQELCNGIDDDCDLLVDEGFDPDGDFVPDCADNCPTVANPQQQNADGDGAGDACDNCIAIPNPSQGDCDGNGNGDACEIAAGAADCNLNGLPDTCDLALGGLDLNANGVPDDCEGIVPFCFGDGAANGGPDCPCGNNVAPGVHRGCVNATGNGAQLVGRGTRSLSGDSVALTASGMTSVTFALFVQAPAADGNGFGTAPFFDGLQCLSGTLVRLVTRETSNGVAAAGFPGAPLSLLGGVLTPGARYYQVYYRSINGPCGTLANTTNSVVIVWQP